jgi:hypothetical protein
MAFEFRELVAGVRQLMVAEVQNAIESGTLYYSKRFNDTGNAAWPSLLLQAAQSYDEHWLASSLDSKSAFKESEGRATPKGGHTTAHVPDTASETLADAEFNRYYMCAVCRKAIAEGKSSVTVYRAKLRSGPRAESEALIDTTFEPAELVDELRKKPLGKSHPLLQPNSGLSIHT